MSDELQPSNGTPEGEHTLRSQGRMPSTAGTDTVAELLASLPRASERLVPERILASGGMGAIQLTSDRALMRQVVRKVLHEEARRNELAVHGLLREAQLMAQLNHPNIVPVHELGVDGELGPWFAMQLVEGQTLGALIAEHHRGEQDEEDFLSLLDVLVKVCEAVAFAHDRGVVHCDIKPDNVMVGDFGQVYLMDWGIARLKPGAPVRSSAVDTGADLGSFTAATSGMATGTLRFAPPEQVKGETDRIDERSDVYSLGAVLYCLLVGAPPHSGTSPKELYEAAAAADPEVLRARLASATAPPALKELVLRAMAKDPAERPASALELRSELQRFVRGGGTFPRVRIPRGQHVLREGEEADAAYLIVSGSCGVYTQLTEGTEDLRRLTAGDLFGEMGILTAGQRTASVVALEDCELVKITREALEGELDSMKPWIRALVRALATRFRESEERWLGDRRPLAPEQLAHQVLLHAQSWGVDVEGGGLRVDRSLVEHSAAALGAASVRWEEALSVFPEIAVEEDAFLVRDPEALAERLRPGSTG